jgi:4-diphosphocytidyl-2-C-methyl-D-erythritol kinase
MLTEIAYAKINLALHVRRRRDDGYHDLETVFAFCADGDVLSADLADNLSLSIQGPFAGNLSLTDNLVIRAAQAIGVTAALQLTKNLPVASGIGGGSADAAATLRLLSKLAGIPLPSIAEQTRLGADVPACVESRPKRGSGVGEVLVATDDVAGTPVLLVNPGVPLSTAAVFARWDGIDGGPLENWQDGRNDLEGPAKTLVPSIGPLIDCLHATDGATLARMSGSGATCFALFESLDMRSEAACRVRAKYPNYWILESVLR